ncbi:MAG: B12-binding domain-containing radical SAM protein [Blastochloris sp.]|nr:B12-binding domain-containing radical SAM protein [Blastochloris sp.]
MTTKRPKVILLSPKGPLYRHKGGIFGKGLRYMPQTFPTLAALVPKEMDIELICLDEGIQTIDPETLEADLVGMTVITGSAPRTYELASVFRRRKIPVVLGGPHITLAPDDAAPHADALVIGWAELSWPRLLRDWQAGRMEAKYTEQPPHILDIPRPDRSVLPSRHYLTDSVFEATRGCVFKCDFCVSPSAWGQKVWKKPVANVVADIRAHGKKRLIFVDLNLTADRQYALELFDALTPLKVQWFGLATTMLVNDAELLEACAESGCTGLLMGLESIDTASLKGINKSFNKPENYARLVERLHQKRIALQGCFVFGHDGETPDVFERTARFAVEAGIDLPRFAISTPFPGTPLHHRLKAAGRLLHEDWSLYDGQHCVFRPSDMTPEELELGTEIAWKMTYSLANSFRRLRRTAAPLPIAIGTNLAYRHYAHNLKKFYTCDWGLAQPLLPKTEWVETAVLGRGTSL